MTPNFSFSFSPETNIFSVLVNNQNLVELNFNILSNNLNTRLCGNRPDTTDQEPNLNEFICLIIDHLTAQKPNLKNFPHYLKKSSDFRSALNFFLYDQIVFHFHKKLKTALDFRSTEFNNSLKKYWLDSIFPTNSNSNKIEIDNSIHLAKMYHHLIHSDFMNLIIKYEYINSLEYNQKYNQFVLSSNNELWSTRIESLKHKQQRQFSRFIFKLYEEYVNQKPAKENLNEYMEEADFDDFEDMNSSSLTKVKVLDENKMSKRSSRLFKDTSFNRIEESYTIQLGAQLKSTHNLRLVRCDILEYCGNRFKINNEVNVENLTDFIEPHSMLTAMSLYSSNKLNVLVLLVDTILDNKSDLNVETKSLESNDLSQAFRQICHKNGYDFHFKSIDEQINLVMKCVNSVKKVEGQNFAKLNLGDFYVTKHSNLSQTHVVFHLAAFDRDSEANSLKQSDLSSRHPVILGLRNILKSCIQNNVQTITIPLLLTHQMTEEMTISWVMKRAELVLKCMKGFMIEFVQWGSLESRNIQFVVPLGLIDETFNSLSSLIKTVFRESRTYLLD
ncbi:hypothetical protein BpHYR1_044065 [Brachionus plicatilis]|uniref:Macro domain-containing protein n=1 Tax=Brachionus plicatilis TaxID=10195 RepID=A0A3M7Q720_BRAPC|nr:hypothetical protein BpHYR1_044065 [Brachionus plicatilis]